MEITVKDNIKQFSGWLDDVKRRQVPYAASRAINDAAIAGQKSMVARIIRIFNNRKKWWLPKQPTGIKVKFSNKHNLHARVYTNAPFAQLQEEGGIKKPIRGKNLAIPTDKVPRKFRTSKGARQMRESNKNVFVTRKGIMRRRSKKKVETLWTFSPSAKVRPALGFEKTVKKAVIQKINRAFPRRLEQALRTARPPR